MLQESIGGDILIHFFYEAHFISALNILTTAHSKSHIIPVQDKLSEGAGAHGPHPLQGLGGLLQGSPEQAQIAVGIKDNMRGLMRGEEGAWGKRQPGGLFPAALLEVLALHGQCEAAYQGSLHFQCLFPE